MPNESWRLIPASERTLGAPLTGALLLRLRDNIGGLAAGLGVDDVPLLEAAFNNSTINASVYIQPDSIDASAKVGAAQIDQSKIANYAASVDKLKTAIDATSVVASAGAIVAGGVTSGNRQYMLGYKSFGWGNPNGALYQMGLCAGETAGLALNWLANTSPEMYIWVYEKTGFGTGGPGSASATVAWQYITASPPYDLEEGGEVVPLFIFARQGPGGAIRQIYTTEDPPWAHLGPTQIAPNLWKSDPSEKDIEPKRRLLPPRPWRRQRVTPSIADLRKGGAARERALDLLRNPQWEEYEITMEVKRRDRDLYPHAFMESLQPGERCILLEPTGDIMHECLEMHRSGENVHQLIVDGYLKIGEDRRRQDLPPGVAAPALTWR